MSAATAPNDRPVRSADLAAAWSARLRRPGEAAQRWPLVVGEYLSDDRVAAHKRGGACRVLMPYRRWWRLADAIVRAA